MKFIEEGRSTHPSSMGQQVKTLSECIATSPAELSLLGDRYASLIIALGAVTTEIYRDRSFTDTSRRLGVLWAEHLFMTPTEGIGELNSLEGDGWTGTWLSYALTRELRSATTPPHIGREAIILGVELKVVADPPVLRIYSLSGDGPLSAEQQQAIHIPPLVQSR